MFAPILFGLFRFKYHHFLIKAHDRRIATASPLELRPVTAQPPALSVKFIGDFLAVAVVARSISRSVTRHGSVDGLARR
jgi:hypothetical protein